MYRHNVEHMSVPAAISTILHTEADPEDKALYSPPPRAIVKISKTRWPPKAYLGDPPFCAPHPQPARDEQPNTRAHTATTTFRNCSESSGNPVADPGFSKWGGAHPVFR